MKQSSFAIAFKPGLSATVLQRFQISGLLGFLIQTYGRYVQIPRLQRAEYHRMDIVK